MPDRPPSSHDATTQVPAAAAGPAGLPTRTDNRTLQPLPEDAPAGRPPVELPPGYRLIHEIHRGGQGVVYLAWQESTQRKVAVKLLREAAFPTAAEQARFEREVHILAALKHPNIVAIHDSGRFAGRSYFVMEFVPGATLSEHIARGPHELHADLRLFMTICRAVDAAHRHGIVHRDLKPGNIRLDEQGVPHVLDFGLAKSVEAVAAADEVTLAGQFVGTLPWASPEQAGALPGEIDARSDVYSLGVILYQLLTRRMPYELGDTLRSALHAIEHAPPTPPRAVRADLPRDVETIILKSLAKAREPRYGSAGELADDVERFLSGEPVAARRDSTVYVAGMQLHRWIGRRPLISHLLALLLAATLANLAGVPIVFWWTSIDQRFRAALHSLRQGAVVPSAWDTLRIIALSDRTDVTGLSRAQGLVGVEDQKLASTRRLHGRLMEKLSIGRPRCVAWDIIFRRPSEFDGSFVDGVRALRSVGADVVLAAPDWTEKENGLPEISPPLIADAKWGSCSVNFGRTGPWTLEVAYSRPGHEPRPSFALATLAAFRRPLSEFTVAVDSDRHEVTLRYWVPNPSVPRARMRVDPEERIRVANCSRVLEDLKELREGDILALEPLEMPGDDVLAAATIEYSEVFTLSGVALREQFAGRIVVVADVRHRQGDHWPHASGRNIAGVYGHAVGVAKMLARASLRSPTDAEIGVIVLVAAAIGWMIGCKYRSRIWLRYGAIVVLAGVGLTLSVCAYLVLDYLCNPIIPLLSAALASEGAAVIERSARWFKVRPGKELG